MNSLTLFFNTTTLFFLVSFSAVSLLSLWLSFVWLLLLLDKDSQTQEDGWYWIGSLERSNCDNVIDAGIHNDDDDTVTFRTIVEKLVDIITLRPYRSSQQQKFTNNIKNIYISKRYTLLLLLLMLLLLMLLMMMPDICVDNDFLHSTLDRSSLA